MQHEWVHKILIMAETDEDDAYVLLFNIAKIKI
jgi:hypothetical protein